VGAGDSFLAGLLLSLDGGVPLPEALRAASAVAAANTVHPGAAVFDPAEIDALAARIEVRYVPDGGSDGDAAAPAADPESAGAS
jgi:1-phosphofructokinase/tagatose 6-phosphate kinase